MTILIAYIAIFAAAFFIVHFFTLRIVHRNDFTSLKTVTFGDESAVKANRIASVISVLAVFFIWGAFTGSKLTPIHVPGPYMGTTEFTYTAENAAGETDSATVTVVVHKLGEDVELPEPAPSSGFAQNDVDSVAAWRSGLIRVNRNDEGREDEGFKITAIDGQPIAVGSPVSVADGSVALTAKGSLNFTPDKGMQMEPIWLPSPEAVWHRYVEIFGDGYQGITLLDHLGWSLLRVCAGFLLGSLIGIPLGYAMGLSGWFRGWFDPIVEFMRPVPPLALIPLVIIWFGIGESGKIILLFLAALWIMTIAARAGVSGVNISKVHAAYSLGASKSQILWHVIVPNSLPEIFTGARVAMGVCWGTVVAAELVAAEKGAGKMIVAASKFQLTDIVIMGIILIGVIGFAIDVLMRRAENWLVPWKGRS
ncbi:ABC transporter permease [Labrenzia sp. R4_1]|jgi:taurine transport system permease protein|uniref:ABC transporter permease n=1 Tax=Stappiaceae TaxID=2821832 RepID=UPI001ADB060C|nr:MULTISPECIES: ABC transporter permease [unclassified Labrenzia]MBO9420946.1 ABC transporter permease [Labrenzia sp. R4_2]MBO9425811.1 ABC transporter permease [Labrenzia sp. R4_1]